MRRRPYKHCDDVLQEDRGGQQSKEKREEEEEEEEDFESGKRCVDDLTNWIICRALPVTPRPRSYAIDRRIRGQESKRELARYRIKLEYCMC